MKPPDGHELRRSTRLDRRSNAVMPGSKPPIGDVLHAAHAVATWYVSPGRSPERVRRSRLGADSYYRLSNLLFKDALTRHVPNVALETSGTTFIVMPNGGKRLGSYEVRCVNKITKMGLLFRYDVHDRPGRPTPEHVWYAWAYVQGGVLAPLGGAREGT